MNFPVRSAFIAATMALIAVAPHAPRAQTPAQMEYERQQREYRQQQERQQQEQQRQQQLMNENARRQQEESRRLNAPMGQSPAPGYQGATPQRATPQSSPRIDATAETAAAKLATTGYAGHMGKGTAVGAGDVPAAWETVTSGNYKGQLFMIACAKS